MDRSTQIKALASETRLKVLSLLAEPEKHFSHQWSADPAEFGVCMTLIAEALGVAQPTASRHLDLLRKAGFIRVRPAREMVLLRARRGGAEGVSRLDEARACPVGGACEAVLRTCAASFACLPKTLPPSRDGELRLGRVGLDRRSSRQERPRAGERGALVIPCGERPSYLALSSAGFRRENVSRRLSQSSIFTP